MKTFQACRDYDLMTRNSKIKRAPMQMQCCSNILGLTKLARYIQDSSVEPPTKVQNAYRAVYERVEVKGCFYVWPLEHSFK